jgi:hypothetical protein
MDKLRMLRLPAIILLVTAAAPLFAQPSPPPPGAPKPQRVYPPPKDAASNPQKPGTPAPLPAAAANTTIEIDLVMTDATQSLQSQTWGRVFDKIGQRVRVKTAGIEEDPKISETNRGPLRTVKLVGRIDRRGTLTFPGKSFTSGDEKALKEWLDELQVFGAQGNPTGQARWGLNTEQFQTLFTSLAEEVTTDVKGQPLVDVARSLGFGIDVPLRIHDTVADRWNPALTVTQDVRGLSRGSALAVLLNDHGLCIRPVRTPGGSVDLVVRSRDQTPDPWPVGWEPKPNVQRSDYAPELFAFRPIGFLDRPVSATIEEARTQTGCPIVIDTPALARKEIDLEKRTFGLPQKKTAWILVLQSALLGTNLVHQIRVDEAGRGFIFITPFESRAANTR